MKKRGKSLPSQKTRPAGFTLIELLTVIAIIGILAAILIPVVQSVRESARAAQCMSNVRQWAMAVLLYSEEHGGYYGIEGTGWHPSHSGDQTENWASTESPYTEYLVPGDGIRDFRTCPSFSPDGDEWGRGTVTYLMAWPRMNGGPTDSLRIPLGSARYPSNLLLFMDAAPQSDHPAYIGQDGLGGAERKLGIGARTRPSYDERHGNLYNAAFADGHTRRVFWGSDDPSAGDSIPAHFDQWFDLSGGH